MAHALPTGSLYLMTAWRDSCQSAYLDFLFGARSDQAPVHIAFYSQINGLKTGVFRLVVQKLFRLFNAEHAAAGNVVIRVVAFLLAALIPAPIRPRKETDPWFLPEVFIHMLCKAIHRHMIRSLCIEGFAQSLPSVGDCLIKYLGH